MSIEVPQTVTAQSSASDNLQAQQKNKTCIQNERLGDKEINKAIYGLLAYFEDHQIKDRLHEKDHASFYSYSESDTGTKSKIKFSFALASKHYSFAIPMFLKVRNMSGEWPSFIHFFPKKLGSQGRTFISVQDSNLFSTAFCLFPLYFFREQLKTEEPPLLENIRSLAHDCIESFKRNSAYNFWPQQQSHYGDTPRVAPLNIWVQIAYGAARFYSHSLLSNVRHFFEQQASLPSAEWITRCLDIQKNPNGADALFNIANDADDSSVALALQKLRKRTDSQANDIDLQVVHELTRFRDINRKKNKRLAAEVWRKENSGAYLTWLRDEQMDSFEQGELGLIPGGINNVDIVVNANVIFALALTGNTQAAGFNESCELLAQAIKEKRWPEAGLYYPQAMIFPYAVSRAIREGGAQHPALASAQAKLLKDVLNAAQEYKNPDNDQLQYYFSGGADAVCDLSTALALNTLLNLGENLARSCACLEQYRQVLSGGIDFLLGKVKYQKAHFRHTEKLFSTPPDEKFIARWEDGLFFSSSYWDLSHWRSQAITNAAVLEVFAKYLLAYDIKNEVSQSAQDSRSHSRQLGIFSYTYENMQKGSWLSLE